MYQKTVAPSARWWEAFGDTQLTALIERAWTGSLSLEQVAARLEQSAAVAAQKGAAAFPDVTAEAEAASGRQRAAGSDEVSTRETYSLGLACRYELDLWGRVRASRRSARSEFLAARADLDEDAVYQITKTIYENLPFLNAIHGATKVMALEKALSGLPLPLHPGAAKYYKEVGIQIPERLIAK